MENLINYPKFHALDSNGDPYSGGKLYTYEVGTSTPKTTYLDRALTTPNDNPIILDSRGDCIVYVSGTVKLLLHDSDDVPVFSMNNIKTGISILLDDDGDTKIEVEKNADEDKIRFDIAGTEQIRLEDGILTPTTDNDIDIGDATHAIKEAHIKNIMLGGIDLYAGSRAKFVWGDATSLLIQPGMYSCMKKHCFWNAEIDKTVDTLTAGEMYYIYLDYSAITSDVAITATELLYVTTEPVWNNTYKGWYNGNDRCIFAIYAPSTNIMSEFLHDGGDLVLYTTDKDDRTLIDIDTTWIDVVLTIPKFSIKAQVIMHTEYIDGSSNLLWKTKGQTESSGHSVAYVDVDSQEAGSHLIVFTDASQTIQLKHSASNGNRSWLATCGWYFPIGM